MNIKMQMNILRTTTPPKALIDQRRGQQKLRTKFPRFIILRSQYIRINLLTVNWILMTVTMKFVTWRLRITRVIVMMEECYLHGHNTNSGWYLYAFR